MNELRALAELAITMGIGAIVGVVITACHFGLRVKNLEDDVKRLRGRKGP